MRGSTGGSGLALLLLALLVATPSACRSDGPPASARGEGHTACTDPRPEMCTQDYRPVCGLRDTGVRCVTTPCDAAWEEKTYSNACAACSHADVHGWRPGACAPEPDAEP